MSMTYIPIDGFPRRDRPYTNIQPLTYRDGMTYALSLEELKTYIRDVLIPAIDTEIGGLNEAWATEVGELVAEVNAKLSTQSGQVNTAIADALVLVNEAVETILSNSLTANDPMVAQLVAGSATATRVALDLLYQPKNTVSDNAVKTLLDSATATRNALDARYFRATGSTLDVTAGGTGRATGATANGLLAAGTTAVGPHQTISPGVSGEMLVSNGAGAPAAFQKVIDDTATAANKLWSSAKITEEIDDATAGTIQSPRGTFASRPAANTVPVGSIYTTTDTLEMFRSNGATWDVIGTGGNELAYVQRTADASTTGGSKVDVPGMSVSWTQGSRPVRVEFEANVKTSLANSSVVVYLVVDGTVVQTIGEASTFFGGVHKGARLSFAAGTSHTAKLQMDGGGTLTMNAAPDAPASISVVAL